MSTAADRWTGAMRAQSVASLTHKEVGFVKHSHRGASQELLSKPARSNYE
jgi:hypothetical protein